MADYTRDDIDLSFAGERLYIVFISRVHAVATDLLGGGEWGPVTITTVEPSETITGTLVDADR